jgi:hypothetical protein
MKRLVVYDVEDLVKAGRGVTGCPYFASRTLMEEASLVMCPYNYLVRACGFGRSEGLSSHSLLPVVVLPAPRCALWFL